MILEHLVQEQHYKIALNSIDPKVLMMKNMFGEIQTYFGGHVKDLKE